MARATCRPSSGPAINRNRNGIIKTRPSAVNLTSRRNISGAFHRTEIAAIPYGQVVIGAKAHLRNVKQASHTWEGLGQGGASSRPGFLFNADGGAGRGWVLPTRAVIALLRRLRENRKRCVA